mmetsp:Transcript_8257/g.17206  ORF Transcript_8257/g.17206 Transcript_8257/m.17206 type:complete len:331 (-) Transcript_8257:37-1029(-)
MAIMTDSEMIGRYLLRTICLDLLLLEGEEALTSSFLPSREVVSCLLLLFSWTPSEDRLVDDLLRMFVRSTPHGRSISTTFGSPKIGLAKFAVAAPVIPPGMAMTTSTAPALLLFPALSSPAQNCFNLSPPIISFPSTSHTPPYVISLKLFSVAEVCIWRRTSLTSAFCESNSSWRSSKRRVLGSIKRRITWMGLAGEFTKPLLPLLSKLLDWVVPSDLATAAEEGAVAERVAFFGGLAVPADEEGTPPTGPGVLRLETLGGLLPVPPCKDTLTTLASSLFFFFFLMDIPLARDLKRPFFFFFVFVVFIEASVMITEIKRARRCYCCYGEQ